MKKHSPFRYFKTSLEIIRLAVMMYVRFPLSLRNVEALLHERGSTSATKRCGSGGTDLARCLPRRFEEKDLVAAIGAPYVTYQEDLGMFFPGIGKNPSTPKSSAAAE